MYVSGAALSGRLCGPSHASVADLLDDEVVEEGLAGWMGRTPRDPGIVALGRGKS